ncbi:MAG: hypothetical protein KDB80_06655 [Planctomycetes bacterium]|nr:hypothetical protein [Planctomycetota bacterium]
MISAFGDKNAFRIAGILCFVAAFCFFVASMLTTDTRPLFLLAGFLNLVAGVLNSIRYRALDAA